MTIPGSASAAAASGSERAGLIEFGAPWIVPAAVATLYISSPSLTWVMVGALAVLGAVASAYLVQKEVARAAFVAACAVAFVPTLFGWGLLTPALGALLLSAQTIRRRGWRALFGRSVPVRAAGIVLIVTVGVVIFQALASQTTAGGLTWSSLPGQSLGPTVVVAIVLGAAATNATFEELLWRVGVDHLFTSRRLLTVRSVVTSALFGLSHAHGTPSGILGIVFAALFGLSMCILREQSRGALIWLIAAHFIADVILIGGAYGLFTW